jgi:hypothetical protein
MEKASQRVEALFDVNNPPLDRGGHGLVAVGGVVLALCPLNSSSNSKNISYAFSG